MKVWLSGIPRLLVGFGIALFVAVFGALHLRNHRAFGSLAYDTAIYDQAVYLMGRTANPFMTVRGLYVHGHHVNPFLFLLVPISWLGGGAEAFLLAQTVCFALAAIPVFGITRYLVAGAPDSDTGLNVDRLSAVPVLSNFEGGTNEPETSERGACEPEANALEAHQQLTTSRGSPVDSACSRQNNACQLPRRNASTCEFGWNESQSTRAVFPTRCTRRRFLGWMQPGADVSAEWIAGGVALAYLGNPMIQWVNWAHFHPESFSTLPFLCAWWAMLRRRWGWYGLCVVILISTREETALAVTMLGLVAVWRVLNLRLGIRRNLLTISKPLAKRRWLWRLVEAPQHVVNRDVGSSNWAISKRAYLPGMLTTFAGGGWYLVCTRFILPRYNNGRPPYYLQTFFGSLGGSVGGIVKTFATDPGKILGLATKQDRLSYYWALGRPMAFTFLASPIQLLMTVPSLLSNILTDSQYPRMIEYQYAAVLAGPLWIATIWSITKLRRNRFLLGLLVAIVLGTTAYSERDFSPAPISKRGQIYWTSPDARSDALTIAVKLVPKNAGVAASDFVLPHLDRRKHAYLWPNPFRERYWGNYDLVTPTPLPDPNNVDWFVVDDRLLEPADGELVTELTGQDGPFEIIYQDAGVTVGRRKPGRISPFISNGPRRFP